MQDDTVPVTMGGYERRFGVTSSHVSGVSWAAIFAGAAAAAALSLILLLLGMGFGFTAASPWSGEGLSAMTITISTAIWLALMQIIASGVGGYLAGRLRVKWTSIHDDEVYFRDTAHGMLSWAVATLVTAAFLGSAMAGLVGAGAKAVGNAASTTVSAAVQGAAGSSSDGQGGSNPLDYFVDAMFRSDQPPATPESPERAQKEAMTILVRSIAAGELSDSDKTYLAGLISRRAGISQADAEQRIDTLYQQAQDQAEQLKQQATEAADTARKSAAAAALWLFVSLLCGAFFASLAAIWGGRRRDLAVIAETRNV